MACEKIIPLRDGPLENLWGGAGEVQKKNSRKGKLNEKNSCTPINPKKYSCNGLNKIHAKNLITKKNSCSSKIPLPPHNFSNGPSLMGCIPIVPLVPVDQWFDESYPFVYIGHVWSVGVLYISLCKGWIRCHLLIKLFCEWGSRGVVRCNWTKGTLLFCSKADFRSAN